MNYVLEVECGLDVRQSALTKTFNVRHRISCSQWWTMRCLLWVWSIKTTVIFAVVKLYAISCYHNRVITGPKCTTVTEMYSWVNPGERRWIVSPEEEWAQHLLRGVVFTNVKIYYLRHFSELLSSGYRFYNYIQRPQTWTGVPHV